MQVSELFVYLGIKADEKKARDFFRILEKGKTSFLGIAAAAVGTTIGIGAMWNKITKSSIALSQFSSQTGLSAQALQKWQHAGEGVGASAETVAGSIASLSARLADIRMSGSGVGPFARMGIDIMTKDVWEVLGELRRLSSSGQISTQMFTNLFQAMGMSGDLIPILRLTNDEFDRMSNREAILSDEQIRQMVKFNVEMKSLGRTITRLFADVFKEVAPQMESTVNKVDDWIKQNRPHIEEFAKVVGEYVGDWLKVATSTWEGLDSLVAKTTGWGNALSLVVAGLIAFKAPWLFFLDAINALNIMSEEKDLGKALLKVRDRTVLGRALVKTPYELGVKLGDWMNTLTDEELAKLAIKQPGLVAAHQAGRVAAFLASQVMPAESPLKFNASEFGPSLQMPGFQGATSSMTNTFNITINTQGDGNDIGKSLEDVLKKTFGTLQQQTQGAIP